MTAVSTIIRQTTPSSTQVTTPEETADRKRRLLDIVDSSVERFAKALEDGQVPMSSTLDLERIAKLGLLLSGEADSISSSTGEVTQESTTSADLDASRIDEILDEDDPDVRSVYERLYGEYNRLNDSEGEQ